MSSWSKFRDKVKNVTRDVATLGTYDKLKQGYDDLTGKDERRKARAAGRTADQAHATAQELYQQQFDVAQQQREALAQQIAEQERRYNDYYRPMEQAIVEDLNTGPDLEGEASIAANRFASDFDRSADAARREAMRYGIQPGTEQMRRTADANTYNRARGIAEAANAARRAEDDAHYLRTADFYSRHGAGLKGEIMQGLADMYGADYTAHGNLAGSRLDAANYHQGVADRWAAESKAGLNSLLNVGTQLGAAYLGGPMGAAAAGALTRRDAPSAQPLSAIPENYIASDRANPVTSPSRYGIPANPYMDLNPATAFGRQNGPNTGLYYKSTGFPTDTFGNGQNGNVQGTMRGAINYR